MDGLRFLPLLWSPCSSLSLCVLLFISMLLTLAVPDRAAVPRVSVWQVLWADMNWLSISLVTGGLAGGLGTTREDDKLRPGYTSPVQELSEVGTGEEYSLLLSFLFSAFMHFVRSDVLLVQNMQLCSSVSKAMRRQVIEVVTVRAWMTHSVVVLGQ